MNQEDYKLLNFEFDHCLGNNCSKSEECVRHKAMLFVHDSERERYSLLNPYKYSRVEECPHYIADKKVTYAWGISNIYNSVLAKDKDAIRLQIQQYFGRSSYYHITSKRRALKPEDQEFIRSLFRDRGYDVDSVEFDRYEEAYPFLMKVHRR